MTKACVIPARLVLLEALLLYEVDKVANGASAQAAAAVVASLMLMVGVAALA